MTETIRWTVRGVDATTVHRIKEVQETSGGSCGDLLNEAVEFWYQSLPDDDGQSADLYS
jgi:hypothetical protein